MGTDILSKIVAQKKIEVAAAEKRAPESLLRERASGKQKRRSFLKAVEKPGPFGVNVIAEIKRASPSRGLIRPDLNPAAYAAAYERAGAAALSVLTDQVFFKGSFDDLQEAGKTVCIPVLRKDFLISSYQIYESRVLGADAVLLIARILSTLQMQEFLHLAGELNMDALVEVHGPEDFEKATAAGARLIGINNRNLSTFETHTDNALRMARYLRQDQIAVAESGIKNRADIEKIRDGGIWNFLIGESLVRAEDPEAFLKSLVRV